MWHSNFTSFLYFYSERTVEGILRTNMPLFFEQDIYCLAIGHHDSVLVSKYEM